MAALYYMIPLGYVSVGLPGQKPYERRRIRNKLCLNRAKGMPACDCSVGQDRQILKKPNYLKIL